MQLGAKSATPRRARVARTFALRRTVARDLAVAFAGKKIDDLDLAANAKAAADALVKEHGTAIIFTSGRRTVTSQAEAMAPHVVKDRQWITKTYADQEVASALQKWVDDHPNAKTAAEIATGLESVIKSWKPEVQKKLSRHLTGDAFDVNPVAGEPGEKIKKSIKALANLHKFLEKEGDDIVWHAQFN